MSEVSKVSICNLALVMVGADRINALDEESKNARICNEVYDDILEDVLVDHPWSFATKKIALAAINETVVYGVEQVYSKPSDFLKLLSSNEPRAVIQVEGDRIISSADNLKIKYIFNQTDSTKYFKKFVTALATRLASEIAYNITNSRTLSIDLLEKYEKVTLPKAIASDSQQGTPPIARQDEWILGRITGPTPLDDFNELEEI